MEYNRETTNNVVIILIVVVVIILALSGCGTHSKQPPLLVPPECEQYATNFSVKEGADARELLSVVIKARKAELISKRKCTSYFKRIWKQH